LKPYLQTLSQNTSFNVSAHPNAGLPNALENMMNATGNASTNKTYLDDNLVNIIGGCCGTTQNTSSYCRYCKGLQTKSFDGGDVMRRNY
jgi:methionine synthase I (cobalamin-dependent)